MSVHLLKIKHVHIEKPRVLVFFFKLFVIFSLCMHHLWWMRSIKSHQWIMTLSLQPTHWQTLGREWRIEAFRVVWLHQSVQVTPEENCSMHHVTLALIWLTPSRQSCNWFKDVELKTIQNKFTTKVSRESAAFNSTVDPVAVMRTSAQSQVCSQVLTGDCPKVSWSQSSSHLLYPEVKCCTHAVV